jgi:Na+/melibiose symporter-like transporter
MSMNLKTRRRWFGALCLLAAIAMLVAGETMLKGRLGALGFFAYWCLCFVATVLAIGVALLDVRAVREETKAAQRALFENTLQKIQEEKARKAGDPAGSQNRSG